MELEKNAKILWNELENKSHWENKAVEDEKCNGDETKPSRQSAFEIWFLENKIELQRQARKIDNPALFEFKKNSLELWNGLEDKSEWETKAAKERAFEMAKNLQIPWSSKKKDSKVKCDTLAERKLVAQQPEHQVQQTQQLQQQQHYQYPPPQHPRPQYGSECKFCLNRSHVLRNPETGQLIPCLMCGAKGV